jgi:hypothetical protein
MSEVTEEFNAYQQELETAASALFELQKDAGDLVRKQTIKAYASLSDAHTLVVGILAAALFRINGKIIQTTTCKEERNSLFASFVIGISACEEAIAEGRYLPAIALLRQEMETLAQLKAVRLGKRNESNSPNVRELDKCLRRMYSELSAGAHVSKHHIVQSVTQWDMMSGKQPGPTTGTRYFPTLDEGLARRCFSLHLGLILGLIEEFSIDLQGDARFTDLDAVALSVAIGIMHEEGMVEILDPELKR